MQGSHNSRLQGWAKAYSFERQKVFPSILAVVSLLFNPFKGNHTLARRLIAQKRPVAATIWQANSDYIKRPLKCPIRIACQRQARLAILKCSPLPGTCSLEDVHSNFNSHLNPGESLKLPGNLSGIHSDRSSEVSPDCLRSS